MPKLTRTPSLLLQLVPMFLVLLASVNKGNAGITSTYIRSASSELHGPVKCDMACQRGTLILQRREQLMKNYTFYKYYSGYIHQCPIDGLEYYYKIGKGNSSSKFWFRTPPNINPDAPYKFGITGDLGQTYNSLSTTLEHYMQSGAQAVLFVGDLSYADRCKYNDVGIRWHTWGRFIDRSAAYKPWFWSTRNHEIEYLPHMYRISNIHCKVSSGDFHRRHESAPIYFTVGDGGNKGGLKERFIDPQPDYFAFRDLIGLD